VAGSDEVEPLVSVAKLDAASERAVEVQPSAEELVVPRVERVAGVPASTAAEHAVAEPLAGVVTSSAPAAEFPDVVGEPVVAAAEELAVFLSAGQNFLAVAVAVQAVARCALYSPAYSLELDAFQAQAER